MRYEVTEDEVTFFWSRAFYAISSEWFEHWRDRLEFPDYLKISNELQKLTKDFGLSIQKIYGWTLPEQPTGLLLKTSEAESSPFLAIWNNSFEQLKAIGIADEIMQWGRKLQKREKDLKNVFPSAWDMLLLDWSLNRKSLNFQTLNISEILVKEIKLIVLKQHIHYLDNHRLVGNAEKGKLDAWETYLYAGGLGGWITNFVFLNSQLSKWKSIISTLNEHELTVFQSWCVNNLPLQRVRVNFTIYELIDAIRDYKE